MSEFDPMSLEAPMTNAMRNYLKMRMQVEAAENLGNNLLSRLFPSQAEKEQRTLTRLDIAQKRRQLGFPDDTKEYEELLNEPKTMLDPGKAIALGSVAISSKVPLLRYGASPFFRGMKNGSIARGLGAIGKYFR